MTQFKEGDVVLISPTLQVNEKVGGLTINDAMAAYKGTLHVISSTHGNDYSMKTADGFIFPAAALQKIEFKKGDTICFRADLKGSTSYDGVGSGQLDKFAGQRFPITKKDGLMVGLDIPGGPWRITLGMLDLASYTPSFVTQSTPVAPAPVAAAPLKVGDQVKIKSTLTIGKKYDGSLFTKSMNRSKGNTATITSVQTGLSGEVYTINLDKGVYSWTPSMLEPIAAPKPTVTTLPQTTLSTPMSTPVLTTLPQANPAVAAAIASAPTVNAAQAAASAAADASKKSAKVRPLEDDEELEAGTVIRIAADLKPAELRGMNLVAPEMIPYAGKDFTIAEVNSTYGVQYMLSDEHGNKLMRPDGVNPFLWNNKMMEGVVKEVKAAKPSATLSPVREWHAGKYLAEKFINYSKFAEAMELALVTGKNIMFYGKGGFAKTEMSRHVLERNGVDPFILSCGEGLTEEKLFGGVNLKKLKESGEIEYLLENSFMNSEYVIFEELFDAPTSVLLSLKDILTSKKFSQGKQRMEIKTKCVFALTNRTREEVGEDDSSKALLERFPLELKVEWDSYDKKDFMQLFSKVSLGQDTKAETVRQIKPSTNLKRDLDLLSGVCAKIIMEGEWLSPRTAMHAAHVVEQAGFSFLKYVNGFSDGQIEALEKELKIKEDIEKQAKQIDDLKVKIQSEEKAIMASTQGSFNDRMIGVIKMMDKYKSEVEGFKKVKDENHKKLQELIKYTEDQKAAYLAQVLAGQSADATTTTAKAKK